MQPSGAEGILLAAGLSTRSGRYKMALPLGDRTVIQRSVENMYAAVDRIWVVTGWQADLVQALLANYARVNCVLNTGYRQGMFSSIKTGLAQTSAARVFVQPGDCAFVSPAVYHQMLQLNAEIVIPTYGGRKGHPVLLSSTVIPGILALPDSANLRDYIQARGFAAHRVEDEGVLLDIDTPEDHSKLSTRYHQGSRNA